MPLTAAKRYLQRIAAWQASTGLSGAPPVAFDKQLSNWVQYCRTIGRRGHLNAEVSEAFTKLGIALDRGPTDANANNTSSFTGPRGFVPVLHAAIAYMEEHGAAPSLRAPNENVRHQAAWLIRLQAGILPANSFGWTAPSEAQVLPQQVLDMAHEVQSPREMVAEWLLWCARAQLALDRPAPGNNWQETTYACSHNLLVRRYPDLVALSEHVRNGGWVRRSDVPDPSHFQSTLSAHTSNVKRRVKRVQFERASIYGRALLNAIEKVVS